VNPRVLIAPDFGRRLPAARDGRQTIEALLADEPPDRRLPDAGRWTAMIKPGLGRRERWRWELPDGGTYYVKRYLGTPLRAQIDRMVHQSPGHSRAWWEYQQSQRLRGSSIPAVRAVAAAESMCGSWELRSAVVFEAAPGDALDRVWPRLVLAGSPLTVGAARHELTVALARVVAALHTGGGCHRDLYLCHIFADFGQSAESARAFTLIDLARMFRPFVRRTRWIVKDLSQLDASARQIGLHRADRLRFLTAYLNCETGSPRVRDCARRVLRRSDAILRRDARKRGRQ
jgi:hypothetical protein